MTRRTEWVTDRQAAAWVMYRTDDAMEKAATADGFAALRYTAGTDLDGSLKWGQRERLIGSIEDLRAALVSGQIKAKGLIEGRYDDIAPVEWRRLALAPRDAARQHPFHEIVLSLRDLRKRWPSTPAMSRSSYEKDRAHDLFLAIETERPGLSQKRAARELRLAYETQIGRRRSPSEALCVHWVREWRPVQRPPK